MLKVTGVKPQVVALGVIDLRKCTDPYLKLKHIYERVQGVISSYLLMSWLSKPLSLEKMYSRC